MKRQLSSIRSIYYPDYSAFKVDFQLWANCFYLSSHLGRQRRTAVQCSPLPAKKKKKMISIPVQLFGQSCQERNGRETRTASKITGSEMLSVTHVGDQPAYHSPAYCRGCKWIYSRKRNLNGGSRWVQLYLPLDSHPFCYQARDAENIPRWGSKSIYLCWIDWNMKTLFILHPHIFSFN